MNYDADNSDDETTSAVPVVVDVERDANRSEATDWPYRALQRSTGRMGTFQVVFRQSVVDEIHLHGQSAKDIEVCGVLVGQGYRDDFGPYLLVEDCIRGTAAASRSTNVTFTAETWQHIQETMDRKHASQKMVGWYHTHPGFGIFLSDMDLFIHGNFFNLPWQIALVYDPHSGEEGNFTWRQGVAVREEVLVENDVTPAAAALPLIDKADAIQGAQVTELLDLVERLQQRVTGLERRARWSVIAIAFLVAFIATLSVQLAPAPPLKATTQPATKPAVPSVAASSRPSH